jgi:poly(3-hydroxybutyrate) depolymerase
MHPGARADGRALAAAALLAAAAILGCATAGGGPSAAGGLVAPAAPAPGLHELTLTLAGGQTVRYTLLVPPHSGERRLPLVVALHYGGKVTPFYGRGIVEGLVQPALAELGAAIVAPDALDQGWDDPLDEGAVLALMDHLLASLPIDRRRVLVTGYSMGGVGAWRRQCGRRSQHGGRRRCQRRAGVAGRRRYRPGTTGVIPGTWQPAQQVDGGGLRP